MADPGGSQLEGYFGGDFPRPAISGGSQLAGQGGEFHCPAVIRCECCDKDLTEAEYRKHLNVEWCMCTFCKGKWIKQRTFYNHRSRSITSTSEDVRRSKRPRHAPTHRLQDILPDECSQAEYDVMHDVMSHQSNTHRDAQKLARLAHEISTHAQTQAMKQALDKSCRSSYNPKAVRADYENPYIERKHSSADQSSSSVHPHIPPPASEPRVGNDDAPPDHTSHEHVSGSEGAAIVGDEDISHGDDADSSDEVGESDGDGDDSDEESRICAQRLVNDDASDLLGDVAIEHPQLAPLGEFAIVEGKHAPAIAPPALALPPDPNITDAQRKQIEADKYSEWFRHVRMQQEESANDPHHDFIYSSLSSMMKGSQSMKSCLESLSNGVRFAQNLFPDHAEHIQGDIPTTIYGLQKFIDTSVFSGDYVDIDICGHTCIAFVDEYKDMTECPKCTALRFTTSADGKNVPMYTFKYKALHKHLIEIFSHEKIAKAMQHMHLEYNSEERDHNVLDDIAHGTAVRDMYQHMPNNIHTLAGLHSADATQITTKSTLSITPFIVSLCNAHPEVRKLPFFHLIIALLPKPPKSDQIVNKHGAIVPPPWHGHNYRAIDRVIANELNWLQTTGVRLFDASLNAHVVKRYKVLAVVQDLVALRQQRLHRGVNSVKGCCQLCEQQGVRCDAIDPITKIKRSTAKVTIYRKCFAN